MPIFISNLFVSAKSFALSEKWQKTTTFFTVQSQKKAIGSRFAL